MSNSELHPKPRGILRWSLVQIHIIDSLKKLLPDASIELMGGAVVGTMLHLKLSAGDHRFTVNWASTGSSSEILRSIYFVKADPDHYIPVIAVPFMGPTGRKLCQENGVNWIDLSGNAAIKAPGLLINISGNPNQFIARGRPSSVFAPKSSRVIRWLLLNPHRRVTKKQLVEATGVDPGHLGRILDRLVESSYLSRDQVDEFAPQNHQLLLADWRTSYDFFKQNEVLRGHIPARTSEELVRKLATRFDVEQAQKFAFTGLAAAWQYTQWATFRLVSVYLKTMPNPDLLQVLLFREEPRGANVWLVVPKDEGVFMGSEIVAGIPCVSRIQAYLDLKDQPERSDEAAEELFRTIEPGLLANG
ncbi:hypothetical protein HZB60_09170 [candidate division KSB1 bacterium]|nr:hypothetical protein [candidate division KSB1 bacterium]